MELHLEGSGPSAWAAGFFFLHVTSDTKKVMVMDIMSKCQPYSLGERMFQRFGGTALATPGLLIIYMITVILKAHIYP